MGLRGGGWAIVCDAEKSRGVKERDDGVVGWEMVVWR